MLGRKIYSDPAFLLQIDKEIYGNEHKSRIQQRNAELYDLYIESWIIKRM